jgi:iron(III) transport system substrate-binding protein
MKNIIYLVIILGLIIFSGCGKKNIREVVIYTSLDQIFSEPILKDFQNKTGIRVRAVYDTEAAKTTGLVNRLIAERNHPQADVFWNSEICRTIILKNKGILIPYFSPQAEDIPKQFKDKEGFWTGFAARARVLIYNTDLVRQDDVPNSIFELTNPKWQNSVALANPLFGTTATHFIALFAILGQDKALKYFNDLVFNDVVLVPGNSISRDRVSDGELKIGFTDTDDAYVAILDKKPVKMIYPDKDNLGTLVIPNTISLINNSPHPKEGRALIDYILSEEIEEKLAFSPSMQIPVRRHIKRPTHVPYLEEIKTMQIDYEKVADETERVAKYLQEIFIK